MTISDIKKSVVVLYQKQIINVKGGSDSTDTTNILIMEDVDAI